MFVAVALAISAKSPIPLQADEFELFDLQQDPWELQVPVCSRLRVHVCGGDAME